MWIETSELPQVGKVKVSPPTWRCGLKLRRFYSVMWVIIVTSHVEVWIETVIVTVTNQRLLVTSHVEVWIETTPQRQNEEQRRSPPTWRCGLKRRLASLWMEVRGHLPRGGVDWNFLQNVTECSRALSPPTWRFWASFVSIVSNLKCENGMPQYSEKKN